MPADTNSTNDAAAVRAVLNEYLRAILDKDAKATISFMSDKAVTFDFAPPLLNDAHGLRDPAPLQAWFDSWDGPIATEVKEPEIVVSNDLAVVFGLQRLSGKKHTGEVVSMWYRATFVFHRVGGRWLIQHFHNSVPMAMDGSGVALTMLHPES